MLTTVIHFIPAEQLLPLPCALSLLRWPWLSPGALPGLCRPGSSPLQQRGAGEDRSQAVSALS